MVATNFPDDMGYTIFFFDKDKLKFRGYFLHLLETPDIVYHPRWVKVTIAGRTKVTHLRRVKVDHL